MAKRTPILFMTSSELGQATVAMSVAHEFLLLPSYAVHIASFAPLAHAIPELNSRAALLTSGSAGTATFHAIAGPSMKEVHAGRNMAFVEPHPGGVRGAVASYKDVLPWTLAPWDGEEYMVGYASCVEIIRALQPAIIMLDPLLGQASDACNTLGVKFTILSPNTFRDHIVTKQAAGAVLWKYPAYASGFPFPVPWRLIMANIYLTFRIVVSGFFSDRIKTFTKYRHDHGIPGVIPTIFSEYRDDIHYLVPSIPEAEYPFDVPANMTPCGPILLPTESLEKSHPELNSWLEQRPTVLVNLGSHVTFDGSSAQEFATAIRVLLDRRPDVQVLWKLKTQGKSRKELLDSEGGVFEVISQEISSGQVRIEDWLTADPIAILQTGHVICMVHHGGANSFHEALCAGVPQVVLPVWLDTYDYANRVEWLGIGAYGSRTSAPLVEAFELSKALVEVIDSNASAAMKERAKRLAEICGKVGGRRRACEKIIEIHESSIL